MLQEKETKTKIDAQVVSETCVAILPCAEPNRYPFACSKHPRIRLPNARPRTEFARSI